MRICGPRGERRAEGRDGLLEAPLLAVGDAQAVVGIDETRIELQRPAEALDGGPDAAGGHVHAPHGVLAGGGSDGLLDPIDRLDARGRQLDARAGLRAAGDQGDGAGAESQGVSGHDGLPLSTAAAHRRQQDAVDLDQRRSQ